MTTSSKSGNNAKVRILPNPNKKYVQFILAGDSDISRWPSHLWPIVVASLPPPLAATADGGVVGVQMRRKAPPAVLNVSKYGALFGDVPAQIQNAQDQLNLGRRRTSGGCDEPPSSSSNTTSSTTSSSSSNTKTQTTNKKTTKVSLESDADPTLVFVICAGENDITSGVAMERIIHSLEQTVLQVYNGRTTNDDTPVDSKLRLVLLGPKLEPWLSGDTASRKRYATLNRRLRSSCLRLEKELDGTGNDETIHGQDDHDTDDEENRIDCEFVAIGRYISYVDCLTTFCEQQQTVKLPPGATTSMVEHGIPDKKYFENDGLHLSLRGYGILKGLVESTVETMLLLSPPVVDR